jgi:hypothetical protein
MYTIFQGANFKNRKWIQLNTKFRININSSSWKNRVNFQKFSPTLKFSGY